MKFKKKANANSNLCNRKIPDTNIGWEPTAGGRAALQRRHKGSSGPVDQNPAMHPCVQFGAPQYEKDMDMLDLEKKENTIGWNPSHFPCPNSQCGIQVLTMILCEAYLFLFKGGFLAVRVGAFWSKPSDLHTLIYLEVTLLEMTFIINVPACTDIQNFLPSSLFHVLHFCQFVVCWPFIYCHRIFLQF